MCGVAGVFAYSSSAAPVDREELRAVRDHMAARGPDGSGEWYSADGRVGLAHRRLAIIDLSPGGAQPMASADGRLVISFNGEIYNYRELRTELQARGRVFRSGSDTEVLLQLYDEYGAAMLDKLRGMFAFALWDARKRAMLLARDPFGIKPLYYSDDGRCLRAASQVKALLRAAVDTRPEPAGHAGFFLWGSVPAPWTLYRGIRSLPAGHLMWIGEQGSTGPESYCAISGILARAAAAPARGTQEEALEHIAGALRGSVQAHLVSDVPVGMFLSAGLDSTMLASLAADAGAPMRTLTLGFSEYAGTPDDEAPLAEQVARQLRAQHSTVMIRRADFESERDRLLAAMDQPSIDGVNTWFVARAAASQGIKVALSGLGGDELFGSYPSFRDVPRLTRWAAPFARVPGLGLFVRRLSAPLLRRLTSPKYAGLIEYGGSIGGAYLLRRGLHMPWELPHVMDPDMASVGWRELQTVAQLEQVTAVAACQPGSRLAVTALEMSWYMRHQLLCDADWASMAHSIEIRLPLVDLSLLNTVAPWFAAHPGISKRQVVAATAPVLPPALLNKPKTGFSVPMREWIGAPSGSERGLRGWARNVHAKQNIPPPVRVLLLATDAYGGHGGIAYYNRCLAEALAAMPRVAEVTVVPRVLRFVGTELPPKIRFQPEAAGSKWEYLRAVTALRGEKFDLVICGHINLLPLAAPFALLKRAPLVLQVHGIDVWQPARLLSRLCLSATRAVWSVSEVSRSRMNRWAQLPLSRYTIIPNTVHLDRFGPAPRSPELVARYALEGRKVIMTLARLAGYERYKGIDEVLEIMPELLKHEPTLTYIVVGDGTDQLRLESKSRALGLAGRVIFTGFVEEALKAEYLRLADVFVLPGKGEGFGIVYLEALACGIPVVGSQKDGSREALLDGELGELADPADSASVRDCILRALKKPRGVPAALSQFEWPRFQERVAAAVQSILPYPGQGSGRLKVDS